MFVAKQFDIVMGVDIHIVQPPGPVPPVPVPHPFVGMVMDPAEFVPQTGFTVLANGIPRAQAGSAVIATVPHIPIGGTFVKPPSNDGELYMGSKTVIIENEPFSFMGNPVLTCQDSGRASPNRESRGGKNKNRINMSPVGVLLPVPKGGMSVTPTEPIVEGKNCGETVAKKYDKKYGGQRPKYASGQVDQVWAIAKKKSPDGIVRCPHCKKKLQRGNRSSRVGKWDMGHKPKYKYSRDLEKLRNCEQIEADFNKNQRKASHYVPECPPCNRSHAFE